MARSYVPPKIPNVALFQRCRALNEEVARLRAALPEESVIAALERIGIDKLPPDQQRVARCILRDKAELAAKQDELDLICTQAEEAVQSLPLANMRRVVQLYCIDGLRYGDIRHISSCSQRTVARYVHALKQHEEPDSVRADGR